MKKLGPSAGKDIASQSNANGKEERESKRIGTSESSQLALKARPYHLRNVVCGTLLRSIVVNVACLPNCQAAITGWAIVSCVVAR